jgi:glycosyltransferase involved in cell wall biosynthesis
MSYRGLEVALVVPCFNEALSISLVIRKFREAMPELKIYVFDNNSTDNTDCVARDEGVEVIRVLMQGKGSVVRRMFADVEADVYVMVDGDATYDAASVSFLVDKLLDDHLDMVVACRKTQEKALGMAYRRGHQWGNRVLTKSVKKIFGGEFSDMLSGYRAFSRRFVKSFPAISSGFEIETELTVHALELNMPYGEIPTPYFARLDGSESKLSTIKDGIRIMKTILRLYMTERPFLFYLICALIIGTISVSASLPVFYEYLKTGLVPRFPTLFVSVGAMICAILLFMCGLILDHVTRGRFEKKMLAYLSIPFIQNISGNL